MIWGAFWGFLLQQKLTPGILCGTVPEDEAWWKKWVRTLVAVGLLVPWALLTLLFALIKYSNAYFDMIFETTLPTVLIGISLYYLTDKVNRHLGLLVLDPLPSCDEAKSPLSISYSGLTSDGQRDNNIKKKSSKTKEKVTDDMDESISSNYSLQNAREEFL